MLPVEVWSIPRLGTFNLHASLLPQYRGAAPINHAVINGEVKTGVTTFLIDHEIDTGNILLTRETIIGPDETAGDIHDRLMVMGADLVVETVKGLAGKSLKPVAQVVPEDIILKKAPKIFPADTVINWNESSSSIHNKIRGLSPYPGAVTTIYSADSNIKIKLFGSRLTDDTSSGPGTIIIREKKRLIITCGNGALEITGLQPEGRKRMTAGEFLQGYNIDKFYAS